MGLSQFSPIELTKKMVNDWPHTAPEELAGYYADEIFLIDADLPEPITNILEWFENIAENFSPFVAKLLKIEEVASNVLYFELLITFNPPGKAQSHILMRSTTIWKRKVIRFHNHRYYNISDFMKIETTRVFI